MENDGDDESKFYIPLADCLKGVKTRSLTGTLLQGRVKDTTGVRH